jgi:LAO/AO transport system kinase
VRRAGSVTELVGRARQGDLRAVARLVSWIEDGAEQLPALMAALADPTRGDGSGPHVVGITGPPGVGKSTLSSALIGAYRARGERVAVLAVDPSSPFSGGALLGDRVRMQEHATDGGVFIRSMASRGHLGGLATATPLALHVLAAAGFAVVLVETVGVGQSEIEVAGTADTVVVVLAPGMGDGIQAAKAGILEIGDVYVVNKSDRDGAETAARELRNMLRLGDPVASDGWDRPVLRTVASTGSGVPELVAALGAHRTWAVEGGALQVRRQARAVDEVTALALARLRDRTVDPLRGALLQDLAARVAAGELDAYRAAAQLLDAGVAQGAAVSAGATPTGPS